MVLRILKNIVKTTMLISAGAALGIWFAPPTAKAALGQRFAMVQKHTTKIQTNADKLWTASLQKKLVNATKSLDPRKIDRKTVDGWIESSKTAVATISADAKKTQETLLKANEVIQSAKSEYRRHGTMFGL